jgi:hypothetical protein
MVLHLHLFRIPITLTLEKGDDGQRELADLREALCWYGLTFADAGQRARHVLRRWARRAS